MASNQATNNNRRAVNQSFCPNSYILLLIYKAEIWLLHIKIQKQILLISKQLQSNNQSFINLQKKSIQMINAMILIFFQNLSIWVKIIQLYVYIQRNILSQTKYLQDKIQTCSVRVYVRRTFSKILRNTRLYLTKIPLSNK